MGLTSWFWPAKDCGTPSNHPAGDSFDRYPATAAALGVGADVKSISSESDSNDMATVTFDEIASRFEKTRQDTIKLREQLHEMSAQLQKLVDEDAKLSLANEQLKIQKFQDQARLRNQRAEIANLQKSLNISTAQQKNHVAQQKNYAFQVASMTKRHDELQSYTSMINDKARDMQLELEMLKCTKSTDDPNTDTANMHLAPQPFVVVLVDGDAYIWAQDLFDRGPSRAAGALAAIRLKNEVGKYIANNLSIPATCKVIARVYINAGTPNPSKKTKSFKTNQADMLESFRVQFTEAMPLFDFVDVGRGKERADQKIRENFHLLLSNPHCHRVFLAACTDNGFARMLEEYQYHTGAYEKIVLVAPGYIEWDIARLGFRYVTWPSVFATREVDLNVKGPKHKRMVIDAQAAQVRVESFVRNEKAKHSLVKQQGDKTMVGIAEKGQVRTAVVGQTVRFGLRSAGKESNRPGSSVNHEATVDPNYDESID